MEPWGYDTAMIADGQVISGDNSGQMHDLAEYFRQEEEGNGQVNIFTFQKATVVEKYIPEQDARLVAAHFPEENWLITSVTSPFSIFLAAVCVAGAVAIAVLLLLAAFFTRRMNRVVLEPVELLVDGANRIQDGNMEEEIDYQGEAEFERVCQSFNDMQRTILENQKQREKNEKARTDMVTGISHDLRTPLTSIQGYIKGVLDGVADTKERQEKYLKTAYDSTREMNVLLQKLFEFSRIESGQMPFHMVRADLAEFTSVYIAQKEEMANPENVTFSLKVGQEAMPEINMDVEQIPRIFDNLLENSMKYAGTRPVEIEISVFATETEVVLEWNDHGNGVPEDKLPHIFERFYRCDEARKEKGSGVGLYVVNYIMEQHHGRVEAENDGGLKIRLLFPKED